MAATGNEIVTLSNVSAAMGLSKNTSVATGNELVTLSNLNAILEAQSSSSGKPSFLGKTWAEISQMSKEIDTLGVDAFREKYLPYLGALAVFPWAGLATSSDSASRLGRQMYGMAMLVGLGQDTDSSNKTVGFTFMIITSPTYGLDYRERYPTRLSDLYIFEYISNDNAYTIRGLGSSFKPYVRAVKRKSGLDNATINLKLWIFSSAELGAVEPADGTDPDLQLTDPKSTYDAFTSLNTDYFSRNALVWMLSGYSLNTGTYPPSQIITSSFGRIYTSSTSFSGYGIAVYGVRDVNGNIDCTKNPVTFKYRIFSDESFNTSYLYPMGFCV